MKNLTISDAINLSSNAVVIGITIVSISLLSSSIWWVINPNQMNHLTNVATYKTDDKLTQSIVNKAPFGVITKKIEPQEAAPSIVDEVTLVGAYASSPANSIAFIQIGGKSSIVKIGDKILEDTVKAIHATEIILTDGKQDITLSMHKGNAKPNDAANSNDASNLNNTNNLIFPDVHNRGKYRNSNNDNNANAPTNSNETMNNQTSQPPAGNANDSPPSGADDVTAQRKKMIEQFQQQNNNN